MTRTVVTGGPAGVLDPLAGRILALIHERGLRVGDPIPTELELIDELAVSRNSVREAIRALRALGIVEIRHGHGTFVGDASLHVLSPSLAFRALAGPDTDPLQGLRHLVDIRELVEVGVVDRLAGALDRVTLDRMAALCDEMAATDLDPAVDREFHRILYSQLDNPLVGQLVDLFWDAYRAARTGITLPDTASAAHTVAAHRAIVAALRTGDRDAARHAMSAHFADIKRRLRPPEAGRTSAAG